MKTKIEIKSYSEKLLFEFEKENNSIKDTIIEAVIQGAYLQGANLQGADLQGANLRGADLQRANLWGANLQEADLKRIYNQTTILPEGDLIIWKKLSNDRIAKLLVPAKAKRVNAIGSRKCRFEYVKTLIIYEGKKRIKESAGSYDSNLIYKVGEFSYPDKFDSSPLIECSNGIHGFIARQEAEDFY